jgi:hypothetical protein
MGSHASLDATSCSSYRLSPKILVLFLTEVFGASWSDPFPHMKLDQYAVVMYVIVVCVIVVVVHACNKYLF